jgi:hypothetical protein
MLKAYTSLIRLYPDDVRTAYSAEMRYDFAARYAHAGLGGRIRQFMFVVAEVARVLCDVTAERINTLYSHRSFHGRCAPNPGLVRPPNMGKREWFGGGGL